NFPLIEVVVDDKQMNSWDCFFQIEEYPEDNSPIIDQNKHLPISPIQISSKPHFFSSNEEAQTQRIQAHPQNPHFIQTLTPTQKKTPSFTHPIRISSKEIPQNAVVCTFFGLYSIG
ncbi:MAG: hypothetical protein Q8881_02705, partial [Sweet potato little leaf phytoplasma]|nr:hypothetical protein [Sweet potato little leaf phytoplasma]